MGRSRGGLTTKIHTLVDEKGRPLRLLITPGQDHDTTGGAHLLQKLGSRTVVLADKGYDADWIRTQIKAQGATANIPIKSNRKALYPFRKKLYRQRNLIERFFNKLKQCRRIATRYDKLGATFLAYIQLAAVRIGLRSIESTA